MTVGWSFIDRGRESDRERVSLSGLASARTTATRPVERRDSREKGLTYDVSVDRKFEVAPNETPLGMIDQGLGHEDPEVVERAIRLADRMEDSVDELAEKRSARRYRYDRREP